MLEHELTAHGERIIALQNDMKRVEAKVDCVDKKVGELKVSFAEIRSAWKTGLRFAALFGALVGSVATILANAWSR